MPLEIVSTNRKFEMSQYLSTSARPCKMKVWGKTVNLI